MNSRVAIVTGGGSGIGAAIARRLAADGLAVAVFDLNGATAEETAASIAAGGDKSLGLAVDVTDAAAIQAGVECVRGRPVILVNNAGMTPHGPFLEITTDMWNRSLEINLTSAFHCCQAVLPGMIEEGWGRIVNISSSSINTGPPQLASYVAAKSGVVGLTKVLAREFGPRGITVNTIPPGFIDTPMLRQSEKGGLMRVEEQESVTPVGRIGRPEDIAAACAFLVRDEAGYITGQVIGVNGGRNT
ncbi:SDR family NAD(P)-dependent oxidoreductase [Parafrankia sp. EUN1f]|uniref:SDR family NAD(P)-dependent oxidoreductase n=1 Tax=Parafrankia sp. EUN1f TaxID=102897 RepID=UPI0001C446FB|nr:SDR family NAD(P)-dependent oxidoreductase [Parafrankia sp. EUN1f]EFC84136.1 short-chain dehydrogenase/reductase SDR [Parafrankia sp. EUN1f]